MVVSAFDGRDVLLAAVADGAGSAARSQDGSRIAVRAFLSHFARQVGIDPDLLRIDKEAVISWLQELRRELTSFADANGSTIQDLACTLLGAVVGSTRAVCFQIGDGAIVVSDSEIGDYSWVFWPQHGEFANSTNFVTQDEFERVLDFELIERRISEIAIFSDGIERLILDLKGTAVHSPALSPIFRWLAGTESKLDTATESPALVAFLNSEQVNRRTDDDKTLVMATRASLVQRPT
jgi:hypothetical protein